MVDNRRPQSPQTSRAATRTVKIAELGRLSVSPSTVSLVIFHQDGAQTRTLRPAVSVVVGRAEPADFVVDDASLSRQHARFTLRDDVVLVEDLGSTNGTHVQGKPIVQARLRLGQDVVLGRVVACVRASAGPDAAAVDLEGHIPFCRLLQHEVDRARHFARPLGLVLARRQCGASASVGSDWWTAVANCLRPPDRAGVYSSDTAEILMPEADLEQVRALAQRLALACSGEVRCGVAHYPDAATTSQSLLEAAQHALSRTSEAEVVACAPSEGSRTWSGDVARGEGAVSAPIAASEAMQKVMDLVDRVASSLIPILILGETGTGKEVIARAIHDRGTRADASMICVNCAAIPAQLVESTLFGHTRGAFTGAESDRVGLFQAANGGTILLDEVGELSPAVQAAFLRVLETKRLTPVGASEERAVDVRVIASTHRDLEAMCEAGSFRRDLLYRLDAMSLEVAPLRERLADIPLLARRFLDEAGSVFERPAAGITEAAIEALICHDWPGNVRELKNAIERAAVIARSDWIDVDDLPQNVRRAAAACSTRLSEASPNPDRLETLLRDSGPFKERMQRVERELIERALEVCEHNQTRASELLGMPRRTLVHKIRVLKVHDS